MSARLRREARTENLVFLEILRGFISSKLFLSAESQKIANMFSSYLDKNIMRNWIRHW